MIVAPGGVDATSICPFVALSGVATVTEGVGCEELVFPAFPLPGVAFGPAQATGKTEARQQRISSRNMVET
jgi:hypothetical protein